MPATAQKRILSPGGNLGVIAGGGALPAKLLEACDADGIDTFTVAFAGQTDQAILTGRNYMLTRLGAAGLIINTLKAHGIRDLVFIGTVRRPSLREMRPDLRTLKFFARLVTRALGDDGLLRAMKAELEQEGFRIHGIQDFIRDIIAVAGVYGARSPGTADKDDIARGFEILRTIGPLDIGQGVVLQEGHVLGVEAAEGTDSLIRRCARLKRTGRGPVLVKGRKAGQDETLDMPTIGPETVITAGESGFSGIVVEAGGTLVIDPQSVAELADEYGLFVVAAAP